MSVLVDQGMLWWERCGWWNGDAIHKKNKAVPAKEIEISTPRQLSTGHRITLLQGQSKSEGLGRSKWVALGLAVSCQLRGAWRNDWHTMLYVYITRWSKQGRWFLRVDENEAGSFENDESIPICELLIYLIVQFPPSSNKYTHLHSWPHFMPSAPCYILCGIAQGHSCKSYDHSKSSSAKIICQTEK